MAFMDVLKSEKNDLEEEISELAIYEPIVVLELFTSQGCSSCPSADMLLEKTKKEFQNVVYAISYHVDYWNYIGWEDPFSKSTYAKRQRKYNIKFRNKSNYTPQLVVNGKEHFVGSSKAKMIMAIDKYKKEKTPNLLNISDIKTHGDAITFSYTVEGPHRDKTIRALLVLDERTTSVQRGENKNRTLKNSNIVVAEKIGNVSSEIQTITLAVPKIVRPTEKISLIVLIEDLDYNITAAAKKSIERF